MLGWQVGKGPGGCVLLGLERDTAQLGVLILQAPAISLLGATRGLFSGWGVGCMGPARGS